MRSKHWMYRQKPIRVWCVLKIATGHKRNETKRENRSNHTENKTEIEMKTKQSQTLFHVIIVLSFVCVYAGFPLISLDFFLRLISIGFGECGL